MEEPRFRCFKCHRKNVKDSRDAVCDDCARSEERKGLKESLIIFK